jgi:hypothetical protein
VREKQAHVVVVLIEFEVCFSLSHSLRLRVAKLRNLESLILAT